MSRIFWFVVLVIAVVVLVRPVRERLKPYLQPAIDPVYESTAKTRVREITRLVKRAEAAGRQVPPPRDFARFVESEDMRQHASLDPWGTPYYLVATRRDYRVGSAGRDRRQGTADDILADPEPYARPPTRRR
ncbi:MAG TPA: hypothetical protein VF746_20295 [Longimicrobium sp.]|jgi:hypothetical protein